MCPASCVTDFVKLVSRVQEQTRYVVRATLETDGSESGAVAVVVSFAGVTSAGDEAVVGFRSWLVCSWGSDAVGVGLGGVVGCDWGSGVGCVGAGGQLLPVERVRVVSVSCVRSVVALAGVGALSRSKTYRRKLGAIFRKCFNCVRNVCGVRGGVVLEVGCGLVLSVVLGR